jgi:hypothetical protein
MVQPLVKHNIIKKRRARFNRHQSDRKISVKQSWRRPKGIDNAWVAARPPAGTWARTHGQQRTQQEGEQVAWLPRCQISCCQAAGRSG